MKRYQRTIFVSFATMREDGSLPSIDEARIGIRAFKEKLSKLYLQEPTKGSNPSFKLWVGSLDNPLHETQPRRILSSVELSFEIYDGSGNRFNDVDGAIAELLKENGELKSGNTVVRLLQVRNPQDVKSPITDWPVERF